MFSYAHAVENFNYASVHCSGVAAYPGVLGPHPLGPGVLRREAHPDDDAHGAAASDCRVLS